MDLSLTLHQLINTMHGLKISFGVNESIDCFDLENKLLLSNNYTNETLLAVNKLCEEYWFRNTPYTFPKHQHLLLEYCMSISAICLCAHLSVYSFVPKLRNTPGKCLMSLSFSLLLVIITYLVSFHIEISPYSIPCIGTALIRLYSFLSAFCWMNVMAIDVYKTFAKSDSSYKLTTNSNKPFRLYSCYAWLMPALIVVASLIVQANTPFDSPYSPAYGKTICCISHFLAMIIFFTCPLSIILTLNVTLFIITAHQLKLTTIQTRLATERKAISTSTVENQLLLNVKLVLVLGLTWIFGFLGMFIKIQLISYISIVFYGLHGTFIFVAFTLRPKVYRLIRSRIKYLRSAKHRRYSDESTCSSRLRIRCNTNSFDTLNHSSITFNTMPSNGYRDRFSSF